MKRLNLGIAARLTLVFVIFAAVLLAGIGMLAFQNGSTSLQAATVSELLSTAIEKQAALDGWMAERQEDLVSISLSHHLQAEVAALVASGSPPADPLGDGHVLEDLRNWTGAGRGFRELLILSPESGRVLAATDAGDVGKFKEDQPFFVNGKLSPFVQNPYYDLAFGGTTATAAAPILSADGQVLAVLAGHLDLDEMNAIISRRTGLHRSDDTFLVNSASLFVTQPRLTTDVSVLQRVIKAEAVSRCLERNSGAISAPDYRDIPALIVYRWLPQRQLCLITKIDQDEALASERSLGTSILIAGVIVLLLASGLAYGLSRTITSPILALTAGTVQVGRGNLAYRIPAGARDELGDLARAFNQMAASQAAIALENARLYQETRALADELELRVVQRTGELRASEERYRALAQAAPDMVFVVDREDRVQYLKDFAASRLRVKAEEVIGKPRAVLFPGAVGEQQLLDLQRVLETGSPRQSESCINFGAGGVWLNTWLVPMRDQAGQVTAVMGVSRDITERKLAEEQLRAFAQDLERSNKELEQFAYVASHDLQEPLRMVASYVQLLARRYRGKLDSDADEFIGFAVDGASRMQDMINDLLALSRLGSRGKPFAPIPLEDVLSEVLDNVKLALEESGAVITHDTLPTVMGDGVQLGQLFQNLIANAIKFRGEAAPRVHIGVQRHDAESPAGRAFWTFSVRDNGIGMDPRYFDRVFLIFQRLHSRDEYPGAGIGLAICKKIVERHGGRIWVESAPGKGSTFYFTLPGSQATANPPPEKSELAIPSLGPG